MAATAEKLVEEKQGVEFPLGTGKGLKETDPVVEEATEEPPYEGMAEPDGTEELTAVEKPPSDQKEVPKKKDEPVFVSKEDRMEAENVNQRKLIAAQQITILQMQINDALRRSQEAAQEANNLQARLEEKYGVDFSTHDIRPADGRVVPKNPASAAFTQRLLGR